MPNLTPYRLSCWLIWCSCRIKSFIQSPSLQKSKAAALCGHRCLAFYNGVIIKGKQSNVKEKQAIPLKNVPNDEYKRRQAGIFVGFFRKRRYCRPEGSSGRRNYRQHIVQEAGCPLDEAIRLGYAPVSATCVLLVAIRLTHAAFPYNR